MKKLLMVMFTLGTVMIGTAQSYNHNQSQFVNRNGHDMYRNSRANDHDSYGNRSVYDYGNYERNRTIVSIGVGLHNNGPVYGQQPTHGVILGHPSNTVVISNDHERREIRHNRRDYRRYQNEHDF
jgi:hypothetical protein